jgi:hypothetical protein
MELKDTGTIVAVDDCYRNDPILKKLGLKVTFRFNTWGEITLNYKGDFHVLTSMLLNKKPIELSVKELL